MQQWKVPGIPPKVRIYSIYYFLRPGVGYSQLNKFPTSFLVKFFSYVDVSTIWVDITENLAIETDSDTAKQRQHSRIWSFLQRRFTAWLVLSHITADAHLQSSFNSTFFTQESLSDCEWEHYNYRDALEYIWKVSHKTLQAGWLWQRLADSEAQLHCDTSVQTCWSTAQWVVFSGAESVSTDTV